MSLGNVVVLPGSSSKYGPFKPLSPGNTVGGSGGVDTTPSSIDDVVAAEREFSIIRGPLTSSSRVGVLLITRPRDRGAQCCPTVPSLVG
ncbi:hypothetical protein ACHAWU_001251 [Discostella pseudostelligera]|uniref:Uncharacterized protein n=1 Tax=Discostella pseudostelligera TaxID=259834 RepID=A0ABD3MCA2_9STRA